MKSKLAIAVAAALLATAGFSLAGGAKVVISVGGNRGWCPPPVPYCPPVTSFRPLPVFAGYPTVSYYSWGPSVAAYSTGNSFTTISSHGTYNAAAPAYRVPAPVITAPPPVTTYPTSSFGWKR